MWKVKRMNAARIVVLTIAVGAGGMAACRASGFGDKPLPTDLAAQLQAPRFNDLGPKRGDGIDAVRFGVSGLPTTQKRLRGRTV
jgi:hypothetical protein